MAKHPYTGPGLNTLVVKSPATGESVFRGTEVTVQSVFDMLSQGHACLNDILKIHPELAYDDASRVVRMAAASVDMVIALVGPGAIEKVDEHGKTGSENPEGLSPRDPMESPAYRRTVRKISDEFREEKGLPPLGITVKEALAAWQAGDITARRAMIATGAADVLELYALLEKHGVETRFDLSEAEKRSVDAVMEAIKKEEGE